MRKKIVADVKSYREPRSQKRLKIEGVFLEFELDKQCKIYASLSR